MSNTEIDHILSSTDDIKLIGKYIDIHEDRHHVFPIVVNNNNFAKAGTSDINSDASGR